MALFKKNKKDTETPNINYFDEVKFEYIENSSNEYLVALADHLLKHFPLIANFENLDVDEANKAISFLSGVIYALGGKVIMVKNQVFMFATTEAYENKEIINLLEDLL